MTGKRRPTVLRVAGAALALGWALSAGAASVLTPWTGEGSQPASPWRYEGLPQQRLPATRFEVVTLDGRRVLRIDAEASYGYLVHDLPEAAAGPAPAPVLSWRWRLERPAAGVDLRTKAGDDAAVKVCALFDLPLDALPFMERQTMRLARTMSGQDLPAATLCYVWDRTLSPDTVLPNAHSPRLRWWVLRGPESAPGDWHDERRDLRADFLRAFGDEARAMPPLRAIAVGADTDNTGSRGRAYVDTPALER